MKPDNLTGAPSALKWLAEKELKAREHEAECLAVLRNAERDQLSKPMEKDGTDWDRLVKVAREQHQFAMDAVAELQKRLLAFDTKIAPERRDTTERISREEGEQLLRRFAVYFRTGVEGLITGLCGDILSCRKPEEVHIMLADKMRENMVGAVDNGVREGHLPAWVKSAMAEVL